MKEDAETSSRLGDVETRTLELDLPPGGLNLEGGGVLPAVTVAYETYGRLRPERDNVIFICHALSGDAHAAGRHAGVPNSAGWWDSMIGPGQGIDTDHYHVI